MSLASHDSQQPSGASSVSSPPRANGKAAPAPPILSGDGNIELQDVPIKLPIEEDIMQLARLGEVGAIQTLFDSGRFNAKYKDEEGITPLHVCYGSAGTCREFLGLTSGYAYSGRRSTITMHCANTSSTLGLTSMPKEENLWQRPLCGPRKDVIITL